MAQRYFEGALHAASYAKFRQPPPSKVTDRILSFLREKYDGPLALCVDVGCGSGQCTHLFSPHFAQVLGTDISQAQIDCARKSHCPSNVKFMVHPADQIPLEDGSVQLITAAQACHWFDLPAFFKEADRVLAPKGVISLFCYGFPMFCHPTERATQLQDVFDHFYKVKTAGYWGPGRAEVDNEYRNIAIPYTSFCREDIWTEPTSTSLEDFVGYLSTWSGFQNYREKNGKEAANQLLRDFVQSCQKVLASDEEPSNIELHMRKKYWILLGRKE